MEKLKIMERKKNGSKSEPRTSIRLQILVLTGVAVILLLAPGRHGSPDAPHAPLRPPHSLPTSHLSPPWSNSSPFFPLFFCFLSNRIGFKRQSSPRLPHLPHPFLSVLPSLPQPPHPHPFLRHTPVGLPTSSASVKRRSLGGRGAVTHGLH